MICRRCEKDIPETRQTEAAKDEPNAKNGKQASWEAAFEEARRNAQTFRMEKETEKVPEEKTEKPKHETAPDQSGQPRKQPETKAASSGQTANRTQRRSEAEPFRQAKGATTRGEETSAGEDRLASLSLTFGILSVASVVFPYMIIPFACAAAACGFLGRKSAKKGSATAGLVIGVIMIVLGFVLMICLSALSPYMEELTNAFTTYMQSAQ